MNRILIACLLIILLGSTAYAQQWDQVNGSMQVKSGPTSPLVIIDQTASGQKILSLRANGTEVCFANATTFTCTGGFTFGGQLLAPDGTAAAPSYSFTSEPNTGWHHTGADATSVMWGSINGTDKVAWDSATQYFPSSGVLSWTDGTIAAGTVDVSLRREGLGHLFQRVGTAAQRSSWANTYTSATNYEAFSVDWQTVANVAIVGTRTAATGTTREVRFGTQTANGGDAYTQTRMSVNALPFFRNGVFTAAGAVQSIGSLTGNFSTFGEFSSAVTSGSVVAAAIIPTYNQASGTAANTDLLINRTPTAVGSGAQLLIDAQNNSVSKWSVSNLGTETTTQTTLGTNVQVLQTTATNDDPVEQVFQNRVTTTGATPTTIQIVTIPTDYTVTISCYVTARRTGGASGAANDGGSWNLEVSMKNTAGTAIEFGAETVRTIGESTAGFNITSAPSTNTELIQVTGAATTDMVWHSTCRTWAVSS